MVSSDSVSVSFWHSLSFSHLRLADQLTKLSKELEDKFIPNTVQTEQELIKPYAIGGITAAVSFLESDINELFELIVDKPKDFSSISKESIEEITIWWKNNKNNNSVSIITKYNSMLEMAKKLKFKRNEIFKNVNILINLRNNLVHYKPAWNTVESEIDGKVISPQKFKRELEDKIMPCKYFEFSSNPFYPDKCLGYGGSKWALTTAYKFSTEFYSLLDVKPNYSHIISRLSEV